MNWLIYHLTGFVAGIMLLLALKLVLEVSARLGRSFRRPVESLTPSRLITLSPQTPSFSS